MNFKEKIEFERQKIADKVLEQIENNNLEWAAGWHKLRNAPFNAKTEKRYNGTNLLILHFEGVKKGYEDPRWLTFNQAKDLGAQVKAGEKATTIFHWNEYDKKTKKAPDWEELKKLPREEYDKYVQDNISYSVSYHSVFNAEQCNGLEKYVVPTLSAEELAKQNEKIEQVIAASEAPVLYDGENRAFYNHREDKIHLPKIENFKTKNDYYATALHEIAHSTGHESRLNRNLKGGTFGDENYAIEELRAEFASLFMQYELDLNFDAKHFENHSAYIQGWSKAIKEDKNVLFAAIKDAGKIATYVRENYAEQENTKKNEGEVMAEEQTAEEKIAMWEEKLADLDKKYSDYADESGRAGASDLSIDEVEFIQKHYEMGDMPDDIINKIVNEDNNYFRNKNYEAYKFTAYETVRHGMIKERTKIFVSDLNRQQTEFFDKKLEKIAENGYFSELDKMVEKIGATEKKIKEKNKIEPLQIHHATEKAVLVKLAIAGQDKLKDTWWSKSRVDLDQNEKNVIAIDNYLQTQYGNILSKQAEIKAAAVGKSVATEQPKLSPMEYAQKMNNMRLDDLAKNVPAEMKALPNWCVLKIYKKDGVTKKFVVNPNNPQGGWAKHNDPSNWTTFDKAMEYARKNNGAGLSFAIKGSGFNAFDLDHCYDKETKTYNETAKKFLADLPNSYAERSVSGTGLHIFTKGSVCENDKYNEARGGAAVEVFETWGFVSMTGNVVDEQHKNLVDLPDEVKKSIQTEIGEKKVYQPQVVRNTYHNYARSDSEVIEVIRKSKKADEFNSLMNGALLCGDHSDTDIKLMGILAYFTNGNVQQMKSIFKQSKLYREKKSDSYYEHTAQKAASNVGQRAR